MNKLKTAVIGVGYLGKFHADKYAAHQDCDLVAVVDANADTAKQIADRHRILALTDYKKLLGKVEAVSIANVTASRVSAKTSVKYVSSRITPTSRLIFIIMSLISTAQAIRKCILVFLKSCIEESTYENSDALKLEITAFIDSIRNGTPVIVDGEAGRRALDTAVHISTLLEQV